MITVPETFARRIIGVHGEKARTWLKRLPIIIEQCRQQWSLSNIAPLPDLSFNIVASAVRYDETDVILKLGVPNPELTCEIAALRHFNGKRTVRLLEADAQQGALLLERLRPGKMLAWLDDDDKATHIAASIMRSLWKPVSSPSPYPTVAKWASGLERFRKRFKGKTGPIPEHLVEHAEALFEELLTSMQQPVLLHGDLHHYNILSHGSEWVMIDPKGVIGETAYDTACFLYNPIPHFLNRTNPRKVMSRRIDIFCEKLGFERDRLLAWGLCQTVLGAWWCVEDDDDGWEYFVSCARIIQSLI